MYAKSISYVEKSLLHHQERKIIFKMMHSKDPFLSSRLFFSAPGWPSVTQVRVRNGESKKTLLHPFESGRVNLFSAFFPIYFRKLYRLFVSAIYIVSYIHLILLQ